MRNIIKTFFAPINRWKFFLYIFLFEIYTNLHTHFMMFFDSDGMLSFYVICIEFIIIFILVFKRLIDIFDKLWKPLIFALLFVILLIVIFFLSLSTVTYGTNGIITSNHTVLWLYPIYSIILVLFLVLKNNKNTKFFNLNWRLTIKRILWLVFIFYICKFLCISFNTTLPMVDYRMYPTFEIQDRLLVRKITKMASLKREDIVCINNNKGLSNPLRIIGLPNEEIKLDGNKIYINDKLYSDEFAFFSSYLKPINYQEVIKLDNNSYFLMGDNRYYDKNGEILTKDRNGNKIWKSINENNAWRYHSENDGKIYLIINKSDLFGKVIAVHYRLLDEKSQRKNISYVFSIINKKFGFNPCSRFENIFGKP